MYVRDPCQETSMALRRALLVMVLLAPALAARAQAQTLPNLVIPSGGGAGAGGAAAARGVIVVPPTTAQDGKPVYWQPNGGQVVIPRFANGATPPAGQLIGLGPASVIQATKETESLPEATRAVVITEDVDKLMRQFQGQA